MSSVEDFVKDNSEKMSEGDIDQVVDNVDEIAAKLRGPLAKFAHKVRLLLDMVVDYRSGTYEGAPLRAVYAIVFALLYVLMPFDLVPDFIPGMGLVDDALVVAVTWKMLSVDIGNYEKWRKQREES